MNTTVHAEGSGAIAIGGDAINSIFVTGGVNQFFVGQYERLADAYLNPKALYRELNLDRFTGREWLARTIDGFLATNDRGYVVVEAEAGMGKTAFLAWLARERGYVHHFVRLMPDPNDIGVALRSLSAQLIRAWDLQDLAVGGVLSSAASRPDFFTDVLYEAADKRDAVRPGEPLVVVVDGLNETAAPSVRANPLALPEDLPGGVYFVVSQRTVHTGLSVVTPRRVVRIRPDSPENLADMHAHLDAAVAEVALTERLAAADVAPENLVRDLLARSAGVWLVLRYVLAELRSGTRRPDDLASLPVGLWQYYAQFWHAWRRDHPDQWADTDLPLLVTLTAVQEPVDLELLCELSGCHDTDRATDLVDDAWRPFLQVQETPRQRYTAFHDSLREFLAGAIDPTMLTSAERTLVGRLADAQRAAHERIADRYLTAWGGLHESLAGLRGEHTAMDDGYGMRHLVLHLVRAGNDPVLHALMELEWAGGDPDADPAQPTNAWYHVHRTRTAFAGYAMDVERAWSAAEQPPGPPDLPDTQRRTALQLRYALIAASVNSVAGNVPADLLAQLIDHQVLTAAQGLELAREITDPRTRAEALTTVAIRLTGAPREDAEREALAAAREIPDGYWRAGELVRLAEVADEAVLAEIARVADGMSRPYDREIVLRALEYRSMEHLPPPAPEQTSSLDPEDPRVFAFQYRERARHGVATLVAGRGGELDGGAGAEAHIAATRFVPLPRWRAEVLTVSAGAVAKDARLDILRAALRISLTVGDHEAVYAALGEIGARLAHLGEVAMALSCLDDLTEPEGLASALFALARRAPEDGRAEIVRRAADAAAGIDDAVVRAEILHRHAPQLAVLPATPAELLDSLGEGWRAVVLAAMAGALPADARAAALTSALAVAERDERDRARILTELVPRLDLPQLSTAHDLAGTIEDREHRDRVRARLAARWGELGDVARVNEVLAAIADPHWSTVARFDAARGLASAGLPDDAVAAATPLAFAPHRAEALALAGRVAQAFAVADEAPDPATRIAVLLRIGAVPGDRDSAEEAKAALLELPDAWPSLVGAVGVALADAGDPHAALDLVRRLPDADRATALLALAPRVGGAVGDAVALAAELRDPAGRVLAALTTPLIAAGGADIGQHLRDALHLLSSGSRAELLAATADLLPGLVETAGAPGLLDLAAAVRTGYRWWP